MSSHYNFDSIWQFFFIFPNFRLYYTKYTKETNIAGSAHFRETANDSGAA